MAAFAHLGRDIFDKDSFRCVGMNASLDGKYTGSAVCEATDVDARNACQHFRSRVTENGSLIREIVAGTGKYGGMFAYNEIDLEKDTM